MQSLLNLNLLMSTQCHPVVEHPSTGKEKLFLVTNDPTPALSIVRVCCVQYQLAAA